MAAPNKPQADADFESVQLRSRRLSFTLFMTTTICFALFFFIIVRSHVGGRNWVQLLPSIGLVAIPLILHPITTHWVYKPWQTIRRKYERTYLD